MKLLATLLVATLLVATRLPCKAQTASNPISVAERALMLGRVDDTINILQPIITANSSNGPAHLLLCRAFYSEDHADEAISECESALKNGLRGNSVAQDWMGRAYGKKADSAGPFAGLKLARKVKDAFEAAVKLDPHNPDAIDDLADYYIQAPSMVGGGVLRAATLAARISAYLPERAQRIRALIAEKKKDNGTAEREFRALADAYPDRPDGWIDLASFFVRTKADDKAVAAIRTGIAVNTRRDPSLFQGSLLLIQMQRDLPLAQQALRLYLTGGAMTDGAPAFKAHDALGKLLSGAGNKAAARSEHLAAFSLAADYGPTRSALAQ